MIWYLSPCIISLAVSLLCHATYNPAWNGFTTPESTILTSFTPYYVPLGAKSYDSSSPLIHYSGKWTESYSKSYVLHTLRWTSQVGASVSFTFRGTGIEWFGNTGSSHGIARVYIDGKIMEDVDPSQYSRHFQQRIFWKTNLPYGKHTIKIVNRGRKHGLNKRSILDVDAFVVTKGVYSSFSPPAPASLSPSLLLSSKAPVPLLLATNSADTAPNSWKLVQNGTTGVAAMQLAVISDTHAIIIDKVEHNPLTITGSPAWAALYNLYTHEVQPLVMQSNSFCAGGTFLGNGTLINVGGNPVVDGHTSAADFGDLDGLQAIRIFEPCDSQSITDCSIYENHARIRMASPRWYNTVLRISDGSAMIIGGSKKGGWINNATVNNPTIEYFPPKSIHGSNGLPIDIPFLNDTLASNLFPIAFSLPDGTIFVAANQDAMIYDWQANTERRLPRIPNGIRVTYPMTGTGLLLPLSPDNGYSPEVLLCGGSTVDDTKPGYEITSQDPASAQCSRMVLTDEGIAAGWLVEQMPGARTMPDAVILPTGQIFIVNGAGTGISGYGNVINQVGASNADNPAFTPVLYNPDAPLNPFSPSGRFSSVGLPTSVIPRLYHSVATLTPNGDIMVAGSNPNLDRSEVEYGTEYRVEWMEPPYMNLERPSFNATSKILGFGKTIHLEVKLPFGAGSQPNLKG